MDIKVKRKEDENYFKRDEYRLFMSDISNGIEIMKIFGYTDIRIFEKFRKKIRVDNVDICLDELPFGLYVEIEGEEKMIEKAVKKLGLEKNQRIIGAYLKLADELGLRDTVFKESNKKEERRRKRRPNINLKLTTLKNILKHRARGYTLESIAKIFDLGSRQEIYKIIKDNKNNPEVINLYQEIEKTQEFINREL